MGITSWVSFLLPATSYPARTSLLVTVFLCQIGIFNSVIQETPNQDGGMTALEIWCLACIIFVFEALLAYVVILVRLGWRNKMGAMNKVVTVGEKFQEIEGVRDVERNWKEEGTL